jgi:hypothetical protein
LISQDVVRGHDTYDSAVVVAESIEQAQNIHPRGKWGGYTWAGKPEDVKAELIGLCIPPRPVGTIICASFNAG